MAKKYDIMVSEMEDKSFPEQQVLGVIAESPQALVQLYRATKQNIRIMREYEDEESRNYGKKKFVDPNSVSLDAGGQQGIMGGTLMTTNPVLEQYMHEHNYNPNNNTPTGGAVALNDFITEEPRGPMTVSGAKQMMQQAQRNMQVQTQQAQQQMQQVQQQTQNQQPVQQIQQRPQSQNIVRQTEPTRYFTIGGIKCKIENGKTYQKQWMRLSDEEMSEFRLVSDATNKICPINGKHIEVMKWVLTQEDSDNNGYSSGQGLVCG